MAYADYQYYLREYHGDLVKEAEWLRLSAEASAWIDRLTFNRAATALTALQDKVKMAMCAIADELKMIRDDGGLDGIVSESIGSASVTYSDTSARRLVKGQRIKNAATLYLEGTGLLYAGFLDGEYGMNTSEI